jgi:hypothetical protein
MCCNAESRHAVGVRENAMFDASFCDAILDPKLDGVRELRVPVSCGQLKSKTAITVAISAYSRADV